MKRYINAVLIISIASILFVLPVEASENVFLSMPQIEINAVSIGTDLAGYIYSFDSVTIENVEVLTISYSTISSELNIISYKKLEKSAQLEQCI